MNNSGDYRMPNRWLIVFSAALISLVGFGSRGVFGVVYVEMLKEFHWDRASLAGVYSVGMLLMGFGGPLAGTLSRKIGFKRYYLISGLLVGLTFLLASRVQTLAQVYWTYGLLGGLSLAALGFGPTQGLVARWFETRRGLAIGIVGAGVGAYPLLAPLAQFLIDAFGWRNALVALGVFFFAAVVLLGTTLMREPPKETGDPQSSDAPRENAGSGGADWTLRGALGTGPIWLIGLAWFFMAVSIHFVNTHLVVLLVGIGHPALLSSSVLASVGVFSVINRAVSGGISDRLGRVRIFVAGVVSACLGLLTLLSLLTGEGARAVGWFYAFAVLFGLGTGAQTTQVTALASDLYRGRFFGSIIGFLTIGFGLGGAVGPWLGGLLFEWTGNYRVMIGYVLAAQAAAALFLIAAGRLGRSLREPPPADAGAR